MLVRLQHQGLGRTAVESEPGEGRWALMVRDLSGRLIPYPASFPPLYSLFFWHTPSRNTVWQGPPLAKGELYVPDPQGMPAPADSTQSRVYYVFPIHTPMIKLNL